MRPNTNKIGLALSGGGFRASLYHLGLVRFLRDAGILSRVTHITSVSGGSVLAAHLVLNWDRYNGSPNEFDAAAREIIDYVRLDVRNRILRRFPLAYFLRWPRRLLGYSNRKLTRTGLLEYHYENYLYGDTSLFQLPERPQLHLLTTNVSEGCLCAFNRDGLLMVRRQPGGTFRIDRIHMGLATVAMAVAASSAFPGFFPPLELSGADVGASRGEFDQQAYTDGAVFDNLGVRMFRVLERPLLADSALSADDFFDLQAAVEAVRLAVQSGADTPLHRLAQVLDGGSKRPGLPELANGGLPGGEGPSAATMIVPGASQPHVLPPPDGDQGNGQEWLVGGLQHLLRHYQLDRDPVFGALKPADPEAETFLRASRLGRRVLTTGDQVWLNRHLIEAAFRQATGHACLRRLNSGLDCVLVSDVGKSIEVQNSRRSGGLIRTALRATDILMDRVWQLEMETFTDTPGFVFAPITDVVQPAEDPTVMHPEVQRQVATIRTDFDRFSSLEISSLVRHGYCIGRKVCRDRPDLFGTDLPSNGPWDPIPAPDGAGRTTAIANRLDGPSREPAPATVEARSLQASAGRRIWSTLLDRRDWTSYLYVPLLIPILVLLPYVSVKTYQRTHRLNQLVNSFSQSSRDLEKMSQLLDYGPPSRLPGVAAEEVARLDAVDHSGFEVIQDSWIMDLRRWKPSEAGKSDPGSQIYHYRRLMVSMDPENTANNLFRWRFLARDPKADFHFPNQEIRPKLRKCLDMDGTVPGERTCQWEGVYDFRNVPPGQNVNLIVEYHSAGRFLEHNETTTAVPLNVRANTAEMTAWILMPDGREYDRFRVFRRAKGKQERAEPVKVVTEYLATDYTIVGFKLLTLDAGYDYEVSWTYK